MEAFAISFLFLFFWNWIRIIGLKQIDNLDVSVDENYSVDTNVGRFENVPNISLEKFQLSEKNSKHHLRDIADVDGPVLNNIWNTKLLAKRVFPINCYR